VGGGTPIAVNVRLVAATNKDLARAVRAQAFREDLYFRLNVIPVALVPLRERPDDIPLLVQHFAALTRLRTGRPLPAWSEEALRLLARYRWPGNVRELGNVVERLIILHPVQDIHADDVRRVIAVDEAPAGTPHLVALPDPAGLEAPLSEMLDGYERLLITRALAASGGNIAEAARRLQTDRPNLYRRMKRLEIVVEGTVTHPA
jgi:two-component system nitrogen regulation response regulator NtrX